MKTPSQIHEQGTRIYQRSTVLAFQRTDAGSLLAWTRHHARYSRVSKAARALLARIKNRPNDHAQL